jgi:hypothetical protein
MQVAVIAITIPWFIMMAKTPYFKVVKNVFAVLVSLAAIGWIAQRTTLTDNLLSQATDRLLLFSPWVVVVLCLLSFAILALTKTTKSWYQVD